jgi:hypothetical protein
MIGLFGGGVGNQIIEGKTIFLQGMPICQETLHLLPNYCRNAPSAKLSVRELRQMEFGTRRDDKKKEGNQRHLNGPVPERKEGDVATSMIYESETLAPGTCLRFGFIASSVTECEWQALAMALVGFFRCPFLGARSSAGYGEVALPNLCRARREITMGAETGPIVDLERPLATVDSVIDPEDRLQLLAEQIEVKYVEDVRGRKEKIIDILGKVV